MNSLRRNLRHSIYFRRLPARPNRRIKCEIENSPIDRNGLHFVSASQQYVDLGNIHISGTNTFAMWQISIVRLVYRVYLK